MSGRCGQLVCGICPHGCRLGEGQTGICHARRNAGGRIVPLAYGKPCAVAVDPMEKKPLFHFRPGTRILSLGMAGCNLRCRNCQNAAISQVSPEAVRSVRLMPDDLVALMRREGVESVAYTYTEPLVAFEYVRDCAQAVRAAGFANVLVSAGYVNPKPLAELVPFLDAANIDLKTMSKIGYRENCGAERDPVLETLRTLGRTDVVLEITNLVIPRFNDSDQDFQDWCKFVAEEVGREAPVHFSRFFPSHRLTDRPPTPPETLRRAAEIARAAGLEHVYCGNFEENEDTDCPRCGALLVRRRGFDVIDNVLQAGVCPRCGRKIYGRF